MMRMHNPPHPGEMLREMWLGPLNLPITRAAKQLSVVGGRAPLEPGELRYFEEIVTARADEIVAKWIDFFVLHKSVTPERITRRLK